MTTPLGQRLSAVKWGKFRITDVFDVRNTHCILANEVTPGSGSIPYLCASADDNAVSSYISHKQELIEKGNCIFIGGKTFVVTYQEQDFYSNDSHNLALYLKSSADANTLHLLFISSCITRSLGGKYTWGNSISHSKIKDDYVSLPITSSGDIDFAFMESFMRELEEERMRELSAYLTASGLDNCELSTSEHEVLGRLGSMEWREFAFSKIFDHIKQGRRLKKDDQLPGNIPFVMSGVTNTGVVNHISNPIAVFPANSVTVDIFGNAFYRNYSFGAGDDTGVYWSEQKAFSKETLLFFAAAMECALHGKFSYGKKLRSSQSLGIKMLLPVCADGTPDYATMELFMRAAQKLVVRDVVAWKDREIAATRQIVDKTVPEFTTPRILQEIASELRFREYLPLYSLKAACGQFGDGETVECEGWVKVNGMKLDKSMFVVQAVGHSMEPRIHDGDLCIMRAGVTGTRQGKIVLAQHHAFSDPETGGAFSIKRYSSEKQISADDSWHHERITLSPLNHDYTPIVLNDNDGDYSIVAEFIQILHGGNAEALPNL